MENRILGLHHITAIAGAAQKNFEFYTKVLGLRLVKKTVNFDDPQTYHLYYGNENGTPGTILTFFPWAGIGAGRAGTGMATEIGYSVPAGSLGFWQKRFEEYNVKHNPIAERFGEEYLSFEDPDGLRISMVVSKTPDNRIAWQSDGVDSNVATKGFHHVALTLKEMKATAGILTEIFGYSNIGQEGNHYRFATDAVDTAHIVDIIESPEDRPGYVAGGTNHHVAFRVANDDIMMEFREKILARGLHITAKIDRNYFFSLYFREPGGVLFELASNNPGFTADEPLGELGTHLKLPPQYEPMRNDIEKVLPPLTA